MSSLAGGEFTVDPTHNSNPDVVRAAAKAIKLVVFDVDGVLTDGKLYYGSDGSEYKAFHVQDGSAIKRLLGAGLEVAVITGRESPMVARRANELGIAHLYQGQESKLAAFHDLLERTSLTAAQTMCIGDDLADLDLFEVPGLKLKIAVSNGHDTLCAAADYVTRLKGGQGVARELTTLLLGTNERPIQQVDG